MDSREHHTHRMLKEYDEQLVHARRLARFRLAHTKAVPPEELEAVRKAKRKALVEQVTREIIENLIVSGSENEIVQEVEKRLEQECGEKLELTYPPEAVDLHIFRLTEEGPEKLSLTETEKVYEQLWSITRNVVDATML